jgi:hypothetical protein
MVMEKSKLEKFITKYNLGGSCESVVFKSDGDTLSVRVISGDKNTVGEVSLKNIKFPQGEFAVYETKKLRAILSVLDENLSIKPNSTGGNITGLNITDGTTKATFVLADASIIPPVPAVVKLPPFDFTITLDEKFINTFIRAKSAINEVDTFAITSDGNENTASVIIGHSKQNTNRITVTANTNKAVKMSPVVFSADHFREILNANKDITNGTFQVSSKGFSIAKFSSGDFSATYYLVQVSI